VGRAREGHQQAFFGLFEQHRKRVYSLCLRLIGSIPEAEELTQDIFMEAFRMLNVIGDDAIFSRWLYHNAVHAVLMRLGQRNPRESSCASRRDEEVWSNSWEVSGLWERLEGQGG
jgi:RNA polymerase sigma-70 factor (ECF subfamily)